MEFLYRPPTWHPRPKPRWLPPPSATPPVAATSITLTLTTDGTTPAASVTGIDWMLLDAADMGAASAILDSGTGESTDGSGVLTIDITGLGLIVDDVRYLVLSNSDGDPAQSPAANGWQGPVTVS